MTRTPKFVVFDEKGNKYNHFSSDNFKNKIKEKRNIEIKVGDIEKLFQRRKNKVFQMSRNYKLKYWHSFDYDIHNKLPIACKKLLNNKDKILKKYISPKKIFETDYKFVIISPKGKKYFIQTIKNGINKTGLSYGVFYTPKEIFDLTKGWHIFSKKYWLSLSEISKCALKKKKEILNISKEFHKGEIK